MQDTAKVNWDVAMSQGPPLTVTLKRGALVAAANWPLVVVQFVTESTFKLLLGVPAVGGIFLVVLLLDADASELLHGDLRSIVAAVAASLRGNPAALAAFAAACLVVVVGGSILTFVVKAGTVTVLADAQASAGAIERPPLRLQALRRAGRTSIDAFLTGVRRFWKRYVRLGMCLLLLYAAIGAGYLGVLIAGYGVTDNFAILLGWTVAAAAASSVLIVWVALVNFLYLLTQMIIAVDDVGVREAMRRVGAFVRGSPRELAGIFGVVFAMVIVATVASVLATAGLGLISFVPIVAIAMMPLQIAAWLLRGFVFQYVGLTALGAYLTQYRHYRHGSSLAAVSGKRPA